jgi:hypothetical protein
MPDIIRSIYIQSQFSALHRWAQAPMAVGFLTHWHRHIFKVRIDLWVTGNDRDLEFFMVQEELNTVLKQWEGCEVEKSCEMFCESILYALENDYPTLFRVEVSEDGENGAVLTRNALSTGPAAAIQPVTPT